MRSVDGGWAGEEPSGGGEATGGGSHGAGWGCRPLRRRAAVAGSESCGGGDGSGAGVGAGPGRSGEPCGGTLPEREALSERDPPSGRGPVAGGSDGPVETGAAGLPGPVLPVAGPLGPSGSAARGRRALGGPVGPVPFGGAAGPFATVFAAEANRSSRESAATEGPVSPLASSYNCRHQSSS
ncbi:hypothetical protein GCM10027075_03760 [Streptomyces heilongjiangensis]